MNSRRADDQVQDLNPRPQKRQRTASYGLEGDLTSSLNPQITPPSSSPPSTNLVPLSPSTLLVSLPSLLLQPADHPNYLQSLYLSLCSLRRCLRLPALTPDVECRAWTGIAEIGLQVIAAGLNEKSGNHEILWTRGIETEIEKAVSKALLIAQKHPSLRLYRPHLTVISAKLATWQNNFKYARNLLRKLILSLDPADPPHSLYAVHLANIDLLLASYTSASKGLSEAQIGAKSLSNVSRAHEALAAVAALRAHAQDKGHAPIILLTAVLRLRILVAVGMWNDVASALKEAEQCLSINFDAPSTSSVGINTDAVNEVQSAEGSNLTPTKPDRSQSPAKAMLAEIPPPEQVSSQDRSASQGSAAATTPKPKAIPKSSPVVPVYEDPFEGCMAAHALMLGVLFFTHAGDAPAATARLVHLHALMDSGIVDRSAGGCVQIHFHPVLSTPPNATTNSSPSSSQTRVHPPPPIEGQRCNMCTPLYLRATHPRILYALAFLVSSTAKRDPGGRKPKRRVFAQEGVIAWEREVRRGFSLLNNSCLWTGPEDITRVERSMVEIKADLLSELAGVSILRSEFDAAEQHLCHLIAHTRTYSIFPAFAPRISLHHAHLAHAQGHADRATDCYEVAERLAEEQRTRINTRSAGDADFVAAAARAGLVSLRIGLHARAPEAVGADDECERDDLEEMGKRVVEECKGMGGTLESIAQVVEACLSKEIIKAKQHLKHALNTATQAQENHLRALILALISSHYFHVSGPHARTMLSTADQLAAGLGAPSTKNAKGGSVGNAPLRMWIGEKFLELYKRVGDEEMVKKQTRLNYVLAEAVKSHLGTSDGDASG